MSPNPPDDDRHGPEGPPTDDRVDPDPLTIGFDSTTEQPATAVLAAVEKHSGVDATALPPLDESLDPDSLDELITDAGAGADDSVATVEFTYAGYYVTVRSDEHVTVVPRTDESD